MGHAAQQNRAANDRGIAPEAPLPQPVAEEGDTLVANLVLVVFAFAFSEQLGRLIGRTGLRAISKIIAMLLAAIAVNMIRRGWAS